MAASLAGAIKALLEGAGLGLAVYRDQSPAGASLPHVTVQEAISVTKSFSGNGDFGDPDAVVVADEQVQVDLWQRWKDSTSGALVESYTLARNVINRLDGAVLATAPTQVHGVRLSSAVRFVEEDENVTHDAITLTVRRNL